jgi:MscS family membrane protein
MRNLASLPFAGRLACGNVSDGIDRTIELCEQFRDAFIMQSCVRWLRLGIAAWLLLLAGIVPCAQGSEKASAVQQAAAALSGSSESEDEKEAESDQDTPRRAIERFLAQAHSGDYFKAAEAIQVSSTDVSDGADKARKLAAVLERRLRLGPDELAKISDLPTGNQSDGLKNQEVIGRIDMPLGSETVRLQRSGTPGSRRWMFSPATVQRIDAWYERLEDHFVLETLPDALLGRGPLGLLYWQWLALPLLIVLSALGGVSVTVMSRPLLRKLLGQRELWLAMLERQREPLWLFFSSLLLLLLLPILFLTPSVAQPVRALNLITIEITLCWIAWRVADVLTTRARLLEWLESRPGLRGVLPLIRQLIGIALTAVAAALALSEMGLSLTSVMASLGLGGLAVALAAKNTLEHFFGSVTLSIDQSIRVGDQIRIGDVNGTIEQIGMRSTRIRTADRSIVTIPNGKVADMQIETIAARDRTRFFLTLGVVYALKPAGMRSLRDALIKCVRSHPKVWPDVVRVHFTGLTDAAITIEVTAWFQVTEQDQFLEARQDLLLQILDVIEAFGATPAFAKALAQPASR